MCLKLTFFTDIESGDLQIIVNSEPEPREFNPYQVTAKLNGPWSIFVSNFYSLTCVLLNLKAGHFTDCAGLFLRPSILTHKSMSTTVHFRLGFRPKP